MDISNYTKAALLTLLWNEPHDDGLPGLVARGLVVRNRVRAGWCGGDWLQCIAKHDEYAANPRGNKPMEFGDPTDPLFRRLLEAVDGIYSGSMKDSVFSLGSPAIATTENSLYYARLDAPISDRFRATVLGNPESHARVATVGSTVFFR